MEIKDFEKLKKDIDTYNNKVIRINANKDILIRDIKAKLAKYGINDIRDYKKLFEMLEARKPEVVKYLAEKEEELKLSQAKLIEVENIITN